jgi:hypothetical protein
MPAVDSKIAVRREHDAVGMKLAHSDQTSISERHWDTGIAHNQASDGRDFIVKIERCFHRASFDEFERWIAASEKSAQQETGFSQHRFAGQQRRREPADLLSRAQR